MASFRLIRESESAMLRGEREQGERHARYSELRDTFHPPFPASAIGYVRRYGSVRKNDATCDENETNTLGKLPPEIVDLIFSRLSPPALIAARATCRAWWRMIMRSVWVLASVLDCVHSPPGRLDQRHEYDEVRLRLLQKELDRQIAVYPGYRQPDIWPLRFRRRIVSFSNPEICKHVHQEYSTSRSRFVSADFTPVGRFMVLLVTNSAGTAPISQQTHNVVLYQIALSGQPLCVGSLPSPESDTRLNIVQGIETQPNKSWSLTIDIDGTARSYSIITREAYAKSDVPFILEEQKTESTLAVAQETNERSPVLKRLWQILIYLPYITGEASGGVRKMALAKHILSGTLWLVKLGPPPETLDLADVHERIKTAQHQDIDDRNDIEVEVVTAVALIVPPKGRWIYRNVAAASFTGPARVAVIWQENVRDHQHTELYLHEIPIVILDRRREEGTAEQRDAYLRRLKMSEPVPLPETLDASGLFFNVYGRRVQSLGWQMGGVHASSPIWDLPTARTSRHSLEVQQELGGLQITLGSNGPRDEFMNSRKCFIWGPAESDEHHVSLVIFDSKYEGAAKVSTNYRLEGKLMSQSNAENPPEYHYRNCACTLHDDGYNIVLPDTACAALIAKTTPSQEKQPPNTEHLEPYPHFGTEEYQEKEELLRKRSGTLFRSPKTQNNLLHPFWTKPPPPTPAPGSIEHYDPPARKEALERRDEELREHIREWKRQGKSDLDIAQAWLNSRWSGWGAIPKPNGWQAL